MIDGSRLVRNRRRRARLRRRRALAAAVIAIGTIAGIAFARSGPGMHTRFHAAGLLPIPGGVASPAASRPSRGAHFPKVAFARAHGVTLYLPAPHVVAVTYHEASFRDALALHPLGHSTHDYNTWKFKPPPATAGPGYIVMSSRGRPTPATSAADVVLDRGTPVRSPVDGTVIQVNPYRLYCHYEDVQVRVRPAGQTRISVLLIHLRSVPVRPGERVFATLSVLGYPRAFPFRSQVDDYIPGRNPHVHIEITRPRTPARRPTC